MSGRLIYEDRGTRISIMARVNAQGPDTLQQTGSRPTRKNPLADRGRALHFGKDREGGGGYYGGGYYGGGYRDQSYRIDCYGRLCPHGFTVQDCVCNPYRGY
jgi:hypothetical protein